MGDPPGEKLVMDKFDRFDENVSQQPNHFLSIGKSS
jgi:hypothetical protein